MPSDPVSGVPDSLLEKVQEFVPDRGVLLISDLPYAPALGWITRTLSSADALASLRPGSGYACGLILTPWVELRRLDAVIAHLRDFLSMDFYVLHPGDALEQTRRMGALGLCCLQIFNICGQSWGLNHFSLKTYKKTPNWLNSRFWANPQLWNKFRW